MIISLKCQSETLTSLMWAGYQLKNIIKPGVDSRGGGEHSHIKKTEVLIIP